MYDTFCNSFLEVWGAVAAKMLDLGRQTRQVTIFGGDSVVSNLMGVFIFVRFRLSESRRYFACIVRTYRYVKIGK